MDAIKQIKRRIYITYFAVCVLGLAIMAQVLRVQFVMGEGLRKRAEEHTLAYRTVDALRGNIYDANYNVIATSVPIYDVYVDINAGAITNKIFESRIDTLTLALGNLFKDKGKNQFRRELTTARNNKDRYILLKREVSFDDLKKLRKFPIFYEDKRSTGSLIVEQKSKRRLPFGMLAQRTIGREIDSLGIEGGFNKYLRGVGGKRLMEKMAGGMWKPINDENSEEPTNGKDVITTIDINLQDVAENELNNKLVETGASFGCVVLMEVGTGNIKAMANLTRHKDGTYSEDLNYAVGSKAEPGSTFKLMSLVAAMEDGLVNPNQLQDSYNGTRSFCDGRTIRDVHTLGGKITIQQAFETSSNVVIAGAVNDAYKASPQKLYNRFKAMHITEPTGIDIRGEATPNIKDPSKQYWSCTSIPWMAHGYELEVTPLQTLTFYNAIANNGKMMKPMLVKEIRDHDKVVQTFAPEVLAEHVCSPATAMNARRMMEAVVNGEHGTGKKLQACLFKVGGKTGTAVINRAGGFNADGTKAYNASFCGYFPADKPKYSCIVFISNPVNGQIYGGEVAMPVFKAVADKVYALDLEFKHPINNSIAATTAPINARGAVIDIETAAKAMGYNVTASGDGPWASGTMTGKSARVSASNINEKIVPDVTGMSIKDAMYLLENVGLRVKPIGYGKVLRQSVAPGSPVTSNQFITIELAN